MIVVCLHAGGANDEWYAATISPPLFAGLDSWELTATEQLAASCKSVCIALAAVKGELGLQAVLEAARLEEEHQIQQWGLVEGGHDIDQSDIRVRVSAPLVFMQLLSLK